MSGERKLAPCRRVRGRIRVPGDKSISHRALMLAAVARGTSRIAGLAPGEDVRSTRRLLERAGAVLRDEDEALVVEGHGWSTLDQDDPSSLLDLDCGNSGTTARLMMGLLAGRRGRFRLSGDASLSRRPMARVREPLAAFGAVIEGGDTLPLTVVGGGLHGAVVSTAVASAQVKSAVILAALQAEGSSEVKEERLTRDHTERLLRAMGAPLQPVDGRGCHHRVGGGCLALSPLSLVVPGDPSSAACAVALAASLPGSDLVVEDLCLNPTRLGFYRLLRRMGAEIDEEVITEAAEPRGRLAIRGGELQGIEVGPADVVDAIDEIPLLACVAAISEGETVIRGAAELRRKESDRIAATVALLRAFGADVEEADDGMLIGGGARLEGARVSAEGDHRIAMCAAFLAAHARGGSVLEDPGWVAISYPRFFDDLERMRA
ncbi:MAG: 3-phosphoshikimate 1-carboxyvinyltransferase [Acidobacteriota bacterium]|nr:3-phosphoshikimate 1-carboxyvinyltransferase [Acidobacteriota bacterium]